MLGNKITQRLFLQCTLYCITFTSGMDKHSLEPITMTAVSKQSAKHDHCFIQLLSNSGKDKYASDPVMAGHNSFCWK